MGYDALTLSVPEQTAEVLKHVTEEASVGGAVQGFKSSARHICLGGECWRRWDPVSPSKLWGLSYESWEFKGAPCTPAVRRMVEHPGRPSRIDVAFDYNVPDDLMPRDFERLVEEHATAAGFDISYSGKRDQYTVYIGSRRSKRMVRCYRRDIKNPLLAAEGFCILRVELELKGELAHAMWARMRLVGPDEAHAAAAAHVLEMTGYAPIEAVGEVPPLLRTDEDTEAVQMIFEFAKQNAVMLEACHICGIDLASLAMHKNERSNHPRKVRERIATKLQYLANIDPARLEATVKALM